MPRETIKNLHQKFLAETNISHHHIHPDLLQILHTELSTTATNPHSPPLPSLPSFPLPSSSSSSPSTAAEPPATATTYPNTTPEEFPMIQSTEQKQTKCRRCNHHRSRALKKTKLGTRLLPMSPPSFTSLPSPFLARRSENKHRT